MPSAGSLIVALKDSPVEKTIKQRDRLSESPFFGIPDKTCLAISDS